MAGASAIAVFSSKHSASLSRKIRRVNRPTDRAAGTTIWPESPQGRGDTGPERSQAYRDAVQEESGVPSQQYTARVLAEKRTSTSKRDREFGEVGSRTALDSEVCG